MTPIPVPKIHTGMRMISMLLDHFFMSLLAFILSIPLIVQFFMLNVKEATYADVHRILSGPLSYIAIAGFSFYFCKDSFNGRSFPKRIFGLQVVDKNSGLAASPLQCLVRSLFCVIWPAEVIVSLINPEQRLGDRVAGTKTIAVDRNSLPKPNINAPQVIISFLIAFGICVALFLWTQKR